MAYYNKNDLFSGIFGADLNAPMSDNNSYLNYPSNNSFMSKFNVGGSNKPGGNSWWDRVMGNKETGPGYLSTGLNVAQGLGNFYLGSKQLKLGRDSLNTQKSQFSDQFNLQKQQINSDIFEQGKRKYDANPSANLTPEQYYEKNKV